MRTLAESLRIATADLLEADPRDIRASKELREGRPFVVLSDAVAGGAGYVQRLFEDSDLSARALVSAAIQVLDCRRPNCATSCSQCLNDYSNQTYWDVFDRLPVLSWLRSLLSDVIERPSHAPENAIPVKAINFVGLQEQLKGAKSLTLSSISLQGAREADRAVSASRLIRDFCEDQRDRRVRLMVCSGLPLSQAPLSTLDRQVIDILLPLEASGQLSICLVPRAVLELAPRFAVGKGDKTAEYYANNFDQPIFDDFFGSTVYLSNSSSAEDWQERNKPHIRQIANSLSATTLNTKAFRHAPGQPRDFKTIFSSIAGRSVRLQIEDPYLASGDRNRGALIDFLKMLRDLNVRIVSLTLAWRPARPGSGYVEERPEEQQRDLSERLRKIGLGGGIVHFKPRISRLGHFHDRVVTASLDEETGNTTHLRWDITSGIDNFMERHRQCSVFLSAAIADAADSHNIRSHAL